MRDLFRYVCNGIAVVFVGLLFVCLNGFEYQFIYLLGYVLCTNFWTRFVRMTTFETYTVGLVWPIAMLHYGLMLLLYRFQNKRWVFNFTTVRYATEQRRSCNDTQ